MTALLALYMVKQLLLPGHAEHVLGLAGGARICSNCAGRCRDLAFASLIYGWYGGLVYFTPILGGLDRRPLARQEGDGRSLGALLMRAGHLAMSFDASFLLALAAADPRVGLPQGQYLRAGRAALPARRGIAAGARLHDLFAGDQHRRGARAAGAGGAAAAIYGWHAGFALAAGADDRRLARLSCRAAPSCRRGRTPAERSARCRR